MQLSTFFIAGLVTVLSSVCSAQQSFGGRRIGQRPSSCAELEVPCNEDAECVELQLVFWGKSVRAVCVPQDKLPDPSCDELGCGENACVVRKGVATLVAACVATSCDEVTCDEDTECVELGFGDGVRAVCVPQSQAPDPSCDEMDCGEVDCVVRKRGRAFEAACVATSCDQLDCGENACVVRKGASTLEAACVATSCDELDCGEGNVCVVRTKGANTKAVCIPGEFYISK